MIEVKLNDVLIPSGIFKALKGALGENFLEGVAQSARNHWIKLASEDSSSFKQEYITGIQEVESSPGEVTIALVGEVPHMLEDGTPQTNMRRILLNPEKTNVVPHGERGMHRSKKGFLYRSIPFRHTIPGSTGTIGQVMGHPYKGLVENFKKLGREVYKVAKTGKRLPPGIGGAFPLKNPTTGTRHKTDIYAGMRRQNRQYHTFRTISDRVNDGSWVRKAFPARNYARKVAEFAGKMIEKALKSLGDTT